MPSSSPEAIRVLDESVVAGIAAGEVVERPASVVKELVENALDAGADCVEVEYDDGGEYRIMVRDNGCGIAPSHVELALTRHATSKIRNLDDLERVSSFGFRGEALASIAAVSDLRLMTRVRGSDSAVTVSVSGGSLVDRGELGSPYGSTLEIRSLFRAVPARRKFLKSKATEFQLVSDTVRRFALAVPSATFSLRRNGSPRFNYPAVSDRRARIRQIHGSRLASSMIELESRWEGLRLSGFVSLAGESWGTSRYLSVFINGRWVRDPLLFRAVMDAYRSYIMKGRYPAVVLFLKVDPSSVDVNVHPAKMEVRFAQPDKVRRFVEEAVGDCVRSKSSPLGRWAQEGAGSTASRAGGDITGRRNAQQRHEPGAGGAPAKRPPLDGATAPDGYRPAREHPGFFAESVADQHDLAFSESQRDGGLGRLDVIGQIFDGYIVCQGEEGLVLVDQHALHERLLYEELMQGWRESRVEVQPLLLPLTLATGADAVEAVSGFSAELLRMGWEIDPFGEEDVVVRAVPAVASGCDVGPLVEGLVKDLAEMGSTVRAAAVVGRAMATVACHSAITVGKKLDRDAARALLRQGGGVEFASCCPHGRPVARALTRSQIERLFGRSASA
ncbi:MAG: DNA mismatch repair endonuclease MutL [Candidatus Binatia bacterium]